MKKIFEGEGGEGIVRPRDKRGYEIDTLTGRTDDDRYFLPPDERDRRASIFKEVEIPHNLAEVLADRTLSDVFRELLRDTEGYKLHMDAHRRASQLNVVRGTQQFFEDTLHIDLDTTFKELFEKDTKHAQMFLNMYASVKKAGRLRL